MTDCSKESVSTNIKKNCEKADEMDGTTGQIVIAAAKASIPQITKVLFRLRRRLMFLLMLLHYLTLALMMAKLMSGITGEMIQDEISVSLGLFCGF